MQQQALWHETVYDALGALVDALGGPKKVGAMLWPAKTLTEAAHHLRHCLNGERAEKLSPEEFLFLLQRGREEGCHVVAQYIGQMCGYDWTPVEPETELVRLEREYIAAVKQLTRLTPQIEQVRAKVRAV